MKPHAAARARTGMLRGHGEISLVGLLLVVTLPACSSSTSTQSCAGGTENYKGSCLPQVTANYLKCIDGRGFSLSNEISGGVTLPEVAGSTFKVAYQRSKQEDSTVTLQIVHDCLTLAEETATSGTDRGAAHQYAQQATQATKVVEQRLPAIELDPPGTLNCGSSDVGVQATCQVTIKSTGVAALDITGVEVTGANSDDFKAGDECTGMSLNPNHNQSCMMTVQFQPSAPGERDATLVIHQNLPPPDHGTPLQLVGTGTGTTPPVVHTLTVTVGPGAGQVTSSSPGINCPGTCTGTFGDGTDITLTAIYNQSGSQLTWEGCDTTSGNNCTVHLTADRAVTARLLPIIT